MLARQRQALILDRVRETGAVRVADLARELGVSDMTVRRDLEILHEHGLLEKVHGGATAISRPRRRTSPGSSPSPRSSRSRRRRSRPRPRGSSSPAWRSRSPPARRPTRSPRAWREIPGVTVVTNSVRVAEVLYRSGRRDQTVILTGGVRTPSEALVGPFAVAQLRSVHLDLVFMGVHGMDGKAGFTCPNLSEAETDRALIESGRRLVVLADHTKWGVIGIASIARLDQADVLVSDTRARRGRPADAARRRCGELILVASTRTIDAGPRRPASTTTTSGGHRPPAVPTDDPARPADATVEALAGEPHRRRNALTGRVGPRLGRPHRPAVAGRRGARAARGPARRTTPAATCAPATRAPRAR